MVINHTFYIFTHTLAGDSINIMNVLFNVISFDTDRRKSEKATATDRMSNEFFR